jgi:DNA-binding CsgD family transcriptional regulator
MRDDKALLKLKLLLAERRKRVLKMRSEGLTWGQCAERLGITPRQARHAGRP